MIRSQLEVEGGIPVKKIPQLSELRDFGIKAWQ